MSNLPQICSISGHRFEISPAELDHIERMSATNAWFGKPIPKPDIHPLEDLRRIVSFINLLNLHHSKSALSGAPQITRYDPSLGTKIVTLDEFWSDEVDNSEVGQPYDFNRPFFEQWHDLFRRSLHLPLTASKIENCDFVNAGINIQNCYLCFHIINSQDCYTSYQVVHCNDVVDCVGAMRSQLCYNCVDIDDCYGCTDSQDLKNCSDCFGCSDLIGCNNCFGCVGLRNNQFAIFNEPVNKQTFEQFIESQNLGSRQARRIAFEKAFAFILGQNHTPQRNINVENCSGDYLFNCKNVAESHFARDCVDCSYVLAASKLKDCHRCYAADSELVYRSIAISAYNEIFGYANHGSRNTAYCFVCLNGCDHCFGCVALKKKHHCILNKQYSEAEYFALVPRIVEHMISTGEWGQFFPPHLSPYYYEESAVPDWFSPLPLEVVRRRGYRVPTTAAAPRPTQPRECSPVPDSVSAINGELSTQRFWCEKSGKAFNFQKPEIEFYRRTGIPLPDNHWHERLRLLLKKRPLLKAN